MNVLDYNSREDVYDFNCGGFALMNFEWYVPVAYRNADCFSEQMVERCANETLEEMPELSRVRHYSDVPDEYDVIGFRVGYYSDDWIDDLHYILRRDGAWYHKMGSAQICEFEEDPDGEWCNGRYNSKIVWFAKNYSGEMLDKVA